jgi:hypothetical protein
MQPQESLHFIFFITYKWAQEARVLHSTCLEKLSRAKHSNLLGPFVSCEGNEVFENKAPEVIFVTLHFLCK